MQGERHYELIKMKGRAGDLLSLHKILLNALCKSDDYEFLRGDYHGKKQGRIIQ